MWLAVTQLRGSTRSLAVSVVESAVKELCSRIVSAHSELRGTCGHARRNFARGL